MPLVQLYQEAAVQMRVQQSLGDIGKVFICQLHMGAGHGPEKAWPLQAYED